MKKRGLYLKKTIKIILIILVILAGISCLLPDLYSLGTIDDKYLYFYKGNFLLSSHECFLQNGQVMYYRALWSSTTQISVGVFLIVGAIAVVIAILSLIVKLIKKITHRND